MAVQVGAQLRGAAPVAGGGDPLGPIAFGLLLAYIFLWDYLGYLISTALFFLVYIRVFGSYRWLPIVMGSLVAAIGSAYVWTLFGMMLPGGILPWP